MNRRGFFASIAAMFGVVAGKLALGAPKTPEASLTLEQFQARYLASHMCFEERFAVSGAKIGDTITVKWPKRFHTDQMVPCQEATSPAEVEFLRSREILCQQREG